MTDADFTMRQVDPQSYNEQFQKLGVRHHRFPLEDSNESQLVSNLFVATQFLNSMLNHEGKSVLIHCNSGLSRSPTVINAYLCLFKRVKQWAYPSNVAQYLKTNYPQAMPNVRVVNELINANLEF